MEAQPVESHPQLQARGLDLARRKHVRPTEEIAYLKGQYEKQKSDYAELVRSCTVIGTLGRQRLWDKEREWALPQEV